MNGDIAYRGRSLMVDEKRGQDSYLCHDKGRSKSSGRSSFE